MPEKFQNIPQPAFEAADLQEGEMDDLLKDMDEAASDLDDSKIA